MCKHTKKGLETRAWSKTYLIGKLDDTGACDLGRMKFNVEFTHSSFFWEWFL